jgi:branched-chain amino acid transport system permease protein
MDLFAISLLNGLVYGLILFMLSSGLTLVFGMMGILNLAHASFFMIGAYVGYVFTSLGYFWLGVVAAPIVVGVMGIVIERTMLRPIHKHGHGQELIFTFGLAFVIEEFVKLFFGDFSVEYSIPKQMSFSAFHLFGNDFPFYRLFMGGVAVAMFILIGVLLTYTRIGLIVRAAERLPVMTAALGHDVWRVFSGVFGLGAALAGLAGAIAGAYYPTSPAMAINFGIIVFVVVVVGGLGSIQGSFWASLLIGVLTSCIIVMDWSLADAARLIGLGDMAKQVGGVFLIPVSALAGVVPFLLMLLVLLFRPAGLMGERK